MFGLAAPAAAAVALEEGRRCLHLFCDMAWFSPVKRVTIMTYFNQRLGNTHAVGDEGPVLGSKQYFGRREQEILCIFRYEKLEWG